MLLLLPVKEIRVMYVVSFGMQHDTPENDCESRPGEIQHVMSPQMTAEASPLIWSECSRKAITVFLEYVKHCSPRLISVTPYIKMFSF